MSGNQSNGNQPIAIGSGTRTTFHAPAPKSSIDLMDYWWILRRRIVLVFSVFAIIFILSLATRKEEKPVYEATCLISISARRPMATIEGARIRWYGGGKTELNTELEMIVRDERLLSDTLQRMIVAAKSETEAVEANDRRYIESLTPEQFKGMIRAQKEPESDLVSITIRADFPVAARLGANCLADEYRGQFAASKTKEAQETKQYIEDQLHDRKEELRLVNADMEQATQRLAEIGSNKVYEDELAKLRIELSKVKEKYTPEHPMVQKLRNQIQKISTQIEGYPKEQMSFEEIQYKQQILKNMIQKLQEHDISAEIELKQLREKALDEIQIVEKAKDGHNITRGSSSINIVVAALFGLLMGAVVAFVWEGMDTSIGKIEDVERITNLSVIAHIPYIGQKDKRSWFSSFSKKRQPRTLDNKVLFNFDNKSVAAEAYRTLRTNIQFATMNLPGNKVISVTSTSPLEGKTLTTTNLALAIAQMGKRILLVEGDLRRPQLAGVFKVDPKPGLSDVLIGSVSAEAAIRTATDILVGSSDWDKVTGDVSIDNLHFLPAGTNAPNPTELVASVTFKNLIEQFRKEYEYVLIDSPPALPVADASIIGAITDGTIFIYQSNTTSRHLLLRAMRTLEKNHANLLGIVINQLSHDVVLPRSYYGRYGYGYGYSYGY